MYSLIHTYVCINGMYINIKSLKFYYQVCYNCFQKYNHFSPFDISIIIRFKILQFLFYKSCDSNKMKTIIKTIHIDNVITLLTNKILYYYVYIVRIRYISIEYRKILHN